MRLMNGAPENVGQSLALYFSGRNAKTGALTAKMTVAGQKTRRETPGNVTKRRETPISASLREFW